VVVDEDGKFAIPILSEEYGGANRLAKKISEMTGAQAVITSRQGKKAEKRYVTIGIGCRRGTSSADIEKAYEEFIWDNDIREDEVSAFASIDLKKDEEGLIEFINKKGLPIAFYSAADLMEVRGEFEPSDFVLKITGCDNVCERAAVKLAGEEVSVHKTAFDGVTLAAVFGVIEPVKEK
jgi:cobalamin biosynthesis protein CbiG